MTPEHKLILKVIGALKRVAKEFAALLDKIQKEEYDK